MSVLRTEGIVKDYPGTRALDDVTVSFDGGKVHAFIGKNGSGKSTLVKVFSGAIQPPPASSSWTIRSCTFPLRQTPSPTALPRSIRS